MPDDIEVHNATLLPSSTANSCCLELRRQLADGRSGEVEEAVLYRPKPGSTVRDGERTSTSLAFVLATPVNEIARTLPRQAQQLLGYAAHDALAMGGGYLGALDLRDPVDMLADGSL